MKWPWWVALVAVIAGFFAGRASVRIDDDQLRLELAEYRSSLHRLADSWVGTWQRLAARDQRIATLERSAAALRAQAGRHMANADTAKADADQLEAELAVATDTATKLTKTLAALAARGVECRECRAANDKLRQAARDDDSTKTELRGKVADLVQGHGDDSTAIAKGQRLIGQLEKQARGCRLPLIGFPCPRAGADYSLTTKAFSVFGGFPVRLGKLPPLTATLSYQVWTP